MKIDPLKIVLGFETSFNKTFYFISGNEVTLMERVKDILIKNYKNEQKIKVEKIKDINLYKNEIGLFEKKNLYIVSSLNNLNEENLEKVSLSDDVFVFLMENSPKCNQIKKIFTNREDSYLFDCYELSKEDKVRILNHKILNENVKLEDSVFWYLIENLDSKYVFFENEIEKVVSLKENKLGIYEVSKLITKNDSGIDKIFFQILNKNEKLVNLYNNKITNNKEVNSFYFSFKQMCLLIINNENEDEFSKNIPRYLFKEKGFLLNLFKKYNNNKKQRLVNLLDETEKQVRKTGDLSLVIGLRFMLSFKKITIS